jgi:hypothetical protein
MQPKAHVSELGWKSRLDAASTEEEVVVVCQDFVALWTRPELAELAPSCRPNAIAESAEVNSYALKLIGHLGMGDRSTAPALHRMSIFFTRAALRLAQLTTPRGESSSGQRNSGTPSA